MTTIFIYIATKTQSWIPHDWRIVISGPEQIKCKSEKTGFKYVTHTIKPWRTYNLKFLIPISNNNGHKEIKICKNDQKNVRCTPITIKTKTGVKKVYVYFYKEDPRPLMFCYSGSAYIPKDKSRYYTEWMKAPGVGKCECDEKGENEPLLKSLTRVVGFLNEVDLSKYPPGTGGNGECNSGAGTPGTCSSTKNGTSCTYDVHTYNGSKVKVKVDCEAVNGKDGSRGECNYKKLTHEPIGMNGKIVGNKSGFRLGDIVYKNKSLGSIDYYSENGAYRNDNKSDHWQKPLVSVSAYFYNEDKGYKDPLLVVLKFKNNGATTYDKEYYMLIMTSERDDEMMWVKDPEAESKVENPSELVKHLDVIRYGLKKVLNVEIAKKSGYGIQLSENPGAGSKEFEPLPNGDKKIEVVKCEAVCPELTNKGYKCYKHKIKDALSTFHDQVAGVAFTIPSERGAGKPIEIKLFNGTAADTCTNGQNGEAIELTYNSCMGDVYVYFYDSKGAGVGKSVDTVPLMLWYHDSYYAPCNRDDYFSKWVQVPTLTSVGEPCKSGEGTELVGELEKVNKALNQIDLDHEKAGGSGYGLPETVNGNKPNESFNTKRVALTRQNGPSQPSGNHAYVKIVHRTVNGYTIGSLTYKNQDILEKGITPNGTGGSESIKVKNGTEPAKTHRNLVKTHNCNTVVAYYSKSDSKYQLPQLILILKTNGVSDPVTSVKGTGYGYYILSAKNGASGFEYVWHLVKEPTTPVTLDDATDFRLLNSAVILLDKRDKNGGTDNNKYDDSEISKAIKTAGLKSPGQDGFEINRLKGKDKTISVTDETAGTCLSKTGFKLITHDISQLVTVTESLQGKLSGVKLIAGLRFLIPTREGKGYKELPLHDGGKRVIYHHNNQNKIYVYFYGSDPRPLMLCYNNCGYTSKDMKNYFKEWVKDTKISNCECDDTGGNGLLKALVRVSNFLNPVMINRITENSGIIETKETGKLYRIHTFNGEKITINLQKQEASGTFCYNRHTHAPNEGFRLGNIEYKGKCIEEIKGEGPRNGTCITSQLNNRHPYTPASEVVTYYYKEDKDHKNPLLVALCKKGDTGNGATTCTYQPYYELQKSDGKDTEPKRYTKCNTSIDLSDTALSNLEKKLDDIWFQISKRLQIIIDRRPAIKLYCPSKDDKKPPVKFTCEQRQNGLKSPSAPKSSTKNDYIPSSYEAQLYQTSSDTPVTKGPAAPNTATTTNAKTDVKVTQVENCWQLNTYGYKCYEHEIKDLPGVEQIGGLKFFLWDNSESKELCLYKESSDGSAPGSSAACTAASATSPAESVQSNCDAPSNNNLELIPNFPYTTCKGNVYVYFYGDDPRPLMLCYGGNAYGPRCVEEYECKWVCVGAVTGCVLVRRYVLLVIFHTMFDVVSGFNKNDCTNFPLHCPQCCTRFLAL